MSHPVITSKSPPNEADETSVLIETHPPDAMPHRPEVHEKQHQLPHGQPGTLQALQSLMGIIVIAVFIITFCVQPFRIPSASMEPTLLVGDFLLVNKQSSVPSSDWLLPTTHIRRGEIVVFHYPVNPAMHLIKRVIGLPGDHIRLRNGQVYINDRLLPETYAMYVPGMPDGYRDNFPRLQSADPDVDSRWWIKMHSLIENGELVVPPNDYFVLGDNRNDSEDSRYWGFVPRDAIVGQPLFIYFSLEQHGSSDEIPSSQVVGSLALRHHISSPLDAVASFARWDRTFRIIK